MKTRSTKIKIQLVEYKTVTVMNLKLTGSRFPSLFLRLHQKLREKRLNSDKVQIFTDIFSKQIYSKS